MKSLQNLCLAAAVFASLASISQAQNAAFGETLQQSRAAIAVHNGKLAGPGAEILRTAIKDANFVLLGEDHGIQQIPQFGSALCSDLGPLGFRTATLEVGPSVAPQLEKFARASDGLQQLAAFDKKYPESIAFYNWREEMEMLQSCNKSFGPEGIRIWGIDQELMGASGFLLEKIAATKLGPESQAAIDALQKENVADYAESSKTGNPNEIFMMKAKQETLDAAAAALKKDGNAEAQKLFHSLLVSREIYQKNLKGAGYSSNRQRAILMKQTLIDPLQQAWRESGQPPKVFFKFGAWHLYRGLNPLHSAEIGNTLNELSEAHNLKLVNIIILGVKGEQLHFAGIGKPFAPVPLDLAGDKDSDFLFLKPFFDNQVENMSTLYDLRLFRDHYRKYGSLDPELERILFAYDFLVLIPDPKPSHTLVSSPN